MLTNVSTQTKEFPTIEFKVELIRHQLSQTAIAERLGVSRPLVTMVINNLCTSAKVRSFLEHILSNMKAGEFTKLEDYHV